MKKLILAAGVVFSNLVFALTPAQDLKVRLNKIDGFSAAFTQEVLSPEKEVLVAGEGTISLSRPNLFRWHTQTPDENILVSDGETLWYYNPFIEQVTATWLQDSTDQTPFVLIVRNNDSDWKRYNIKQDGNQFTLDAKDNTNNMPTFVIDVSQDGTIKQLSLIEQDGQKSIFNLINFKVELPEASLFRMELPQGVEIDDQRAR